MEFLRNFSKNKIAILKRNDESPKRKVTRTKRSSPRQKSDSDSEDEEAETNRSRRSQPAAKRGPKKKSSKKKESEEDGEISSADDDSNKEEFDDGLDEDLIGDDADRANLEKMTEREREEELFKRAENREALKKRFEIQKKLKQQQKLKSAKENLHHADPDQVDEIDYNNVLDTKERSQTRQKKMEEKKFDQKSSALSELKAKRQEKERKDAERQKKEEEGDHSRKVRKRQSSGSSSSSGSERSRRSSTSSQSSSDGDSDTERFKKSPSKVQKYIETQEDLEPIRLSRFKMEKFVHLPFFKKLVPNCFVRIGIGQHQGRSVYRAAEIIDVVETGKVYLVGKVRTNIGLKLRFGKQERVFRLEFISNQRISPQEFNKWKEACIESNMALPTIEFVKTKEKEIKKALNYNFTSDDVDKIVAQKEKFQRHPTNYAMHKARLIKEKEIAIANGEDEKSKELEQRLNELEERAEELDKKRTSTISSVSLINDRNRKANVSKAEAAILQEMKMKRHEGPQENPFARKKCNPRIVTKSSAAAAMAAAKAPPAPAVTVPPVLPPPPLDIMASVEKSQQKENVGDPIKRKNEADEGQEKAKKKSKFGSGLPLSMQKEDLFDAHNFDIEIDVDTSMTPGNPGAAPASSGAASVVTPINIKPAAREGGPGKRSFNLDDYKKKRGLI